MIAHAHSQRCTAYTGIKKKINCKTKTKNVYSNGQVTCFFFKKIKYWMHIYIKAYNLFEQKKNSIICMIGQYHKCHYPIINVIIQSDKFNWGSFQNKIVLLCLCMLSHHYWKKNSSQCIAMQKNLPFEFFTYFFLYLFYFNSVVLCCCIGQQLVQYLNYIILQSLM